MTNFNIIEIWVTVYPSTEKAYFLLSNGTCSTFFWVGNRLSKEIYKMLPSAAEDVRLI